MTDYPLEPPRQVRDSWADHVAQFINDHIDGLDTAPANGLSVDVPPLDITDQLSDQPHPGGMRAILKLIGAKAAKSINTVGPGYLAYVPGGGIFTAALADFLADGLNRYSGLAAAAPHLVQLEADVLAWLAHEFGYPKTARGILTSGGSLANLSAAATARITKLPDDIDSRRAVAYVSSQVHHSIAKGLRLIGISPAQVRKVPVDASFHLDVNALREQIKADRAAQCFPFLVVASAGTTNTGTIDPLPELASLCAAEDLWLHVDGAYGGAFVLCEQGKARLRGIERADSITFDPHKGMFLPYGTGCLLVRDGDKLREAHQLDAEYLQDLTASGEIIPSPCDYGPELSRAFRGLRLWLPLMLHGAQAFRDALQEKLLLASHLHRSLLKRIERGAPLEIVAAPELSIVTFRLKRRTDETLEAWNHRNAALNTAINARQRVYLSTTMLPVADGLALTLRVCVLSFRTHKDRIDMLLEDLDAALTDPACT